MNKVEYIEDIPWLQELPSNIANIEYSQRVAFRKNQLLTTRHGIPSWAFLLSGSGQWIQFDPSTEKVKIIAEIKPGSFLGQENLPPGSIAVATVDSELLLIPKSLDQADPTSRTKSVTRAKKTPSNDIPFHAYHLDYFPSPFAIGVDIGASTGNFSHLLAGYCDKVSGVESNILSSSLAVDRMCAMGYENYSAIQAYAEELPYEPESIDLIGCRMAIHQFQKPEKFAAEAKRVLRIGGVIAITDLIAPDDSESGHLLNLIEHIRDPAHGQVLTKKSMLDCYTSNFETVATLDTLLKIPMLPWLRQANIETSRIHELHQRISSSSSKAREVLGINGDLQSDRISFDSKRLSIILKRIK
ncbi:methyltransferase domain-containing protein [Chromobacterium vaccinii]|uniref:Methyltransferase domain-containing protein n=1 Tax=Chromobacterium vaccinii TaxID=1108595 RepID=A0ABV0FGN2_9NEIS